MKRIKIVIGAVVAVVVLVVVVVAVYLLTRDEAPEAVDLGAAVARVEAAETAEDDSDTPSVTEPAGDDTGTASADATTDVATTSNDDDDDPCGGYRCPGGR